MQVNLFPPRPGLEYYRTKTDQFRNVSISVGVHRVRQMTNPCEVVGNTKGGGAPDSRKIGFAKGGGARDSGKNYFASGGGARDSGKNYFARNGNLCVQ